MLRRASAKHNQPYYSCLFGKARRRTPLRFPTTGDNLSNTQEEKRVEILYLRTIYSALCRIALQTPPCLDRRARPMPWRRFATALRLVTRHTVRLSTTLSLHLLLFTALLTPASRRSSFSSPPPTGALRVRRPPHRTSPLPPLRAPPAFHVPVHDTAALYAAKTRPFTRSSHRWLKVACALRCYSSTTRPSPASPSTPRRRMRTRRTYRRRCSFRRARPPRPLRR